MMSGTTALFVWTLRADSRSVWPHVVRGGFAFMMLFYGTLSDSFGRRPVILVALVMYTLGSVGAALAPTFGWNPVKDKPQGGKPHHRGQKPNRNHGGGNGQQKQGQQNTDFLAQLRTLLGQ